MKLQPNPFYRCARLAVDKNSQLRRSWSGVVFRSVLLQFAKPEQIISGDGAMKSGARWNPPGIIRALYCSLNPATAAEESMVMFDAAGLKRVTVRPRLIVGIRHRLSAVIELPELVGAIHGADLDELMAEEWQKINALGHETQGQALGRALFDARVEGFHAPSARVPGAVNLVVFPSNLRRTGRLEVLQIKELTNWLKP